ncbi:MAG: response regulator [Candidatus Omnitrophica bacterium]|nr:response regulator [Candidatus Omnitrophota bacterium]
MIDDEELIVKSLKKLLEKNGFEVFVAKNGQDGIIIADEENFDLIIADMRMPGISGAEAVHKIFENLDKNNLPRYPVLFITGYADGEMEDKAKSLNPVAYIYKPFDILELVNKIKEVVK